MCILITICVSNHATKRAHENVYIVNIYQIMAITENQNKGSKSIHRVKHLLEELKSI